MPCKILLDKSSKVNVNIVSFGTTATDIKSIEPASIGETVTLVWVNLSYADVNVIESWLLFSRATKRFVYLNQVYLLEDGYTIQISNNKPTIEASFRRVS
jgi:hypothetical protein